MSASSFADWQIACDHPDCRASIWASNLSTFDQTATSLRKKLKARGWTVNVPNPNQYIRTRQDFCPDHKPEAAS
jgi:hypothetical protein